MSKSVLPLICVPRYQQDFIQVTLIETTGFSYHLILHTTRSGVSTVGKIGILTVFVSLLWTEVWLLATATPTSIPQENARRGERFDMSLNII